MWQHGLFLLLSPIRFLLVKITTPASEYLKMNLGSFIIKVSLTGYKTQVSMTESP